MVLSESGHTYDEEEKLMAKTFDRKLILEDGSEYLGYGFGSTRERVCELVFNTSMVGYQEVVSDPSYTNQAVVMTYPMIGNYGINEEDCETQRPSGVALIVGEYNDRPSNFRCTRTLADIMEEYGFPGIEGIDTRKLTRRIRDKGSCKVLITSAETTLEQGMAILNGTELPKDSVCRTSTRRPWRSRIPSPKFHVAVVDCGMKIASIDPLNDAGCNLTVLPYSATAEEILALKADGIYISDGPGNPKDQMGLVELIRTLKGTLPICGVGLGHELIAMAYGGKVYKMPVGHRGTNRPVVDLSTGRSEVVDENHGYAVDEASLEGTGLVVTGRDLMDGTVESLCCEEDRVLTVQYNPGTAAGPNGRATLLDQFLTLMGEEKHHA